MRSNKARRSAEARAERATVAAVTKRIGRVPPFDIEAGASIPYGPLRNHVITYSYQCISEALAGTMGVADLNWVTFAAWASRTVGHVLDENELPHAFEVLEGHSALATATRGVLKLGRVLVLTDHRQALIDGNLAVFNDTAAVLAQLIPFLTSPPDLPPSCPSHVPDAGHGDAAFERWLDGLHAPAQRPDLQPVLPVLRDAFRLYRLASPMPSDVVRSELIFAANCMIGEYEQQLLQPAIQRALFDPPKSGPFRSLIGNAAAQAMTPLLAAYTPNGVIRCADEMSVPQGVVCRIGRTSPQTPHAAAVLQKYPAFDPPANRLTDWTDYDQRMRWIVEFFRCYHADWTLFESPFAYDDERLDNEFRQSLESAVRRFSVDRSTTPGAGRLSPELLDAAKSLNRAVNAKPPEAPRAASAAESRGRDVKGSAMTGDDAARE